MSNKVNPRRKPATQADVDKAYCRGIDTAIVMMLWNLIDKHGATYDDIATHSKELTELAGHIGSGRIKLKDIESALSVDYDTEISLSKIVKDKGV